jgi:transposase
MVTEGGHKAAEVARSLGIHQNQLYNWKRKFSDQGEKAFPGKGHLTELAALRRQLREVEMERDILKKAVGIFSKPTGNGSGL